MKLQDVLPALQQGKRITRISWGGYVQLITSSSESEIELRFVRNNGELVERNVQLFGDDFLADDWYLWEG